MPKQTYFDEKWLNDGKFIVVKVEILCCCQEKSWNCHGMELWIRTDVCEWCTV